MTLSAGVVCLDEELVGGAVLQAESLIEGVAWVTGRAFAEVWRRAGQTALRTAEALVVDRVDDFGGLAVF